MIEIIRQLFSKTPRIRKGLSFIYRKLIYPFSSGYLFYRIYYVLFCFRQEKSEFSKIGLFDVEIYNYNNWKIGKGLDKAFRRYFKAKYNNEEVFVKVASKSDSTVFNEIQIQKKVSSKNYSFCPKAYYWNESFSIDLQIIVFEFIPDLREIDFTQLNHDLYSAFEMILDEFQAIGLVHADIHKGNLLINQNQKVFLLDFGISRFVDIPNKVNYIARPGTYYIEQDNIRIYDDAYSFVKMIECNTEANTIFSDDFYQIKKRIGSNSFGIDTNEQ